MKRCFTGRVFLVLALCILAVPSAGLGHDIIKGGNAFYNGMLHPFLSLPHILVLIALACMLGKSAGASQDAAKQKAWWFFLVALAAGLACATFGIGFPAEKVLLVLAGILGLILAGHWTLPRTLYFTLATLSGLLMGWAFAEEEAAALIGLNFGTLVSLYLVFLYLALFSRKFSRKPWQVVGFRVLGSWIAAAALLNLALDLLVKKAQE